MKHSREKPVEKIVEKPMVMLPVLIIFISFQKYFLEGISFSGMGGR